MAKDIQSEVIEAIAEDMVLSDGMPRGAPEFKPYADDYKRIITTILSDHGAAIVPREPTEAMWSGLARDMMMWLSFSGRPTPQSLLDHLEAKGTPIPQWLLDEPEMQPRDHVPSKGARVVWIFKAMLAAQESES